MLERLREYREGGLSFEDAIEAVRASTVFTTHTPVPAGHDTFPFTMLEKYFMRSCTSLGTGREQVLEAGRAPGSNDADLNITCLALQLSGHRTGVRRAHGAIAGRVRALV